MKHLIELVTALLGCGGVAFGSTCLFRFGQANECTPAVERLSWCAMVGGTFAVVAALFGAALLG